MDSLKDDRLVEVSERYNVARFFSLSPEGRVRHQRVVKREDADADELLDALLNVSGSVNVRTFTPDQKQRSLPFVFGLQSKDEAWIAITNALSSGLHVIVNETIDVSDGGVSGVTDGQIIEFGPDETPRGVEHGGFASLPLSVGRHILRRVYGTDPPATRGRRIEFSLHPAEAGFRRMPYTVWETGPTEVGPLEHATFDWPNSFSRLIGDKTFGLLVADALGHYVPDTTVISRRVAPFRFGQATGQVRRWMRTAPSVQEPGRFTTTDVWTDPFRTLGVEDPGGDRIPAVLAQAAVAAKFSGAAETGDRTVIEGVAGEGDEFMLGSAAPTELPDYVRKEVEQTLDTLRDEIQSEVAIEWAFDGEHVWVLQLHSRRVKSGVERQTLRWVEIDPSIGLESLRERVARLDRDQTGVILTRPVGITSHIGQVLRLAGIAVRRKE